MLRPVTNFVALAVCVSCVPAAAPQPASSAAGEDESASFGSGRRGVSNGSARSETPGLEEPIDVDVGPVTVVHAGSGPAERLTYSAAEGTRVPLTTMAVPDPKGYASQLAIDYTLTRLADHEGRPAFHLQMDRLDFGSGDEDTEDLPGARAVVGPKEVELLDEMPTYTQDIEANETLFEDLTQALAAVLAVFPEKPVGVGATWRQTRHIAQPLDAQATTTTTLLAREGSRVLLLQHVDVQLDNDRLFELSQGRNATAASVGIDALRSIRPEGAHVSSQALLRMHEEARIEHTDESKNATFRALVNRLKIERVVLEEIDLDSLEFHRLTTQAGPSTDRETTFVTGKSPLFDNFALARILRAKDERAPTLARGLRTLEAASLIIALRACLGSESATTRAPCQKALEKITDRPERSPEDFTTWLEWSIALSTEDTRAVLTRAVTDPSLDAELRGELRVFEGQHHQDEGRPAEAHASFLAALELAPENVAVREAVSWWLATAPVDEYRNGKEALRLAESLPVGRRSDRFHVLTMAAAYAAVERYATAEALLRNWIAHGGASTEEATEMARLADHLHERLPWIEEYARPPRPTSPY